MQTKSFSAALVFLGLFLPCIAQLNAQDVKEQKALIPLTDPRIQLLGRYDASLPGKVRLAFPGTGFKLRFQGKGIVVHVESSDRQDVLVVLYDHRPTQTHLNAHTFLLSYEGESEDPKVHSLEIRKLDESWHGIVSISGIELMDSTKLLDAPDREPRRLLFIGDSVTCGEGVNGNAECKDHELEQLAVEKKYNLPFRTEPRYDSFNSYGMLLGRKLDAETQLVCYGGRGLVRDYRGFTAADNILTVPQIADLAIPTDKPEDRVPWDASKWQPDAIFVSVGTNDFNLQKTKPLDEKSWGAEYLKFLAQLRHEYPKAHIFVTEGAIVTDPLLAKMVKTAAETSGDNKILYVPSKHYSGFPCDAHPTGAEHKKMVEDFEPILRSTLGW